MTPPRAQRGGNGRPAGGTPVPDSDTPVAGKTVVIGLGNRYLGDDGVGLAVADELQHTRLDTGLVVRAHQTFDLWLLSEYAGASRLIIIDAARSGAAPGTVTEYGVVPHSGPYGSIPGLHSLGLHDLADFATQTGLLSCPLTIIGVEPKDCSLGEGLSDEVERAVYEVVALVTGNLRRSPQSVVGA